MLRRTTHSPRPRPSRPAAVYGGIAAVVVSGILAGCSSGHRSDNFPDAPESVQWLLGGLEDADMCSKITDGSSAPEGSSMDRMWFCRTDGRHVRIGSYDSEEEAATATAQIQISDLCFKLANGSGGETLGVALLLDDANAYGLLEDLEQIGAGDIYTRHESFPEKTVLDDIDPPDDCGPIDVFDASRWDQYRDTYQDDL